MLGWLLEKNRMAKIAGLWFDATSLNPGDNGQIGLAASDFIKSTGARPEDAFLTALVNWAFHHPNPESKFVLAEGIQKFLEIYGFSAGLSPECRDAAMLAAKGMQVECSEFSPAVRRLKEAVGQEVYARIEVQQKKASGDRSDVVCVGEVEQKKSAVPAFIRITKNDAFRPALDFLSLEMCHQGFFIEWMGDGRGDVPSLIAKKDSVKYHVLMHLDLWPADSEPANFMLQRLKEGAAKAGAYSRIARVSACNRMADNDSDKSNVTLGNIGFYLFELQVV